MKGKFARFYRSDLAEELYKLRSRYNLSQKIVAKYLNCSLSSIYFWEKGRSSPSIIMIAKLSLLFNVSSDYFLNKRLNKNYDYHQLLDQILKYQAEILKNNNFLIDFDANL